MKLTLAIDGTQADIATILGAFGDAGLRQSITEFSATLAVFGQHQGAIMATQTELIADLEAVSAQLGKIGAESAATLQKVADLEAAIAAGGFSSPALDAAVVALKAQAQLVDDLVPDAAPKP